MMPIGFLRKREVTKDELGTCFTKVDERMDEAENLDYSYYDSIVYIWRNGICNGIARSCDMGDSFLYRTRK